MLEQGAEMGNDREDFLMKPLFVLWFMWKRRNEPVIQKEETETTTTVKRLKKAITEYSGLAK